MTTKDVLEIKKLIKFDKDSSIKLYGCYVAGDESEKVTYLNNYLSNLPEVEQHKFIEIIKKTLSGSFGKNLYDLPLTKDACKEGMQQSYLYSFLNEDKKSDEVLNEFYDKVIEKFDIEGNYLILIACNTYDVPVKTKDDIELDDSTEVFKHFICALCPVNLSKPALSYHEDTNSIENRIRDWVVEPPCAGFMFPSFDNRSSNIYNILYYVKNPKEMYHEFISEFLGCEESMPSVTQKEIFNDIIKDVVENNPKYDVVTVVRDINENLNDMIEENTTEEPVKLNKESIKNLFKESGINVEDIEKVEEHFSDSDILDDTSELDAQSVVEKKKFDVKTNDVTLSVKPENSHIVKIKIIDGVKCIVIPVDNNLEINGIMATVKKEIEENMQ